MSKLFSKLLGIQLAEKADQKVENKAEQNSIAPTISQPQVIKKLSREESIQNSNRIKIENNSITGSLNLKGV